MTAQIHESLIYKDEKLGMYVEPLEQYFLKIGARPQFARTSSACWRGYQGIWEISSNKLFLIGLEGTEYLYEHSEPKLHDGTKVTIHTLFPNADEKVFADWYSGEIRCPQGEEIRYVHAGYESPYERNMLIQIENGIVVSEQVIENLEAQAFREMMKNRPASADELDIPAFLRKS